jgi:hypothetical protein
MRVGLLIVVLALLGACADVGSLPPPGEPTVASGGSTRRVTADWDDVHAAVDLAVSQSQTAMLRQRARGGGGGADRCTVYDLLTIRDDTGILEICREREGPPLTDQPESLLITARIGAAGDANYERMLLDYLEKRLTQLIGDKAAPVPDPFGYNR